jgi:PAS domain S-box-containing protein
LRAAQVLQESEKRFRSLVENLVDGIVLVDRQGKVRLLNKSAQEMFGYARDELDGESVDVLLPESVRGDHAARRASFAASPRPRPMGADKDLRALRKDGTEFPVDISLTPLEMPDGLMVAAAVTDITERRHAEQELARRAADLARSNAELEQFAYVASHDLQEPLRMVSNYTQLLARRYEGRLDTDADEFITFAVDGARRMQTLINDLLAFSRVGTRGREPEPTDCEGVLQQALMNLKAAIEESGAQITSDPLPTVSGDEGQLVQLLQNLIGNAIKFRGEDAPRVHVSAREEGVDWVFSVADNGIGLDEQYRDRIFVIFQRLHGREQYPGTGIGLAICRKIVERHGGRIWVESEPGQGATFYRKRRRRERRRWSHDEYGHQRKVAHAEHQAHRDHDGRRQPGRRAPDAGGAEGGQGLEPPDGRRGRRPRARAAARGTRQPLAARPRAARPQPAEEERPRSAGRNQDRRGPA